MSRLSIAGVRLPQLFLFLISFLILALAQPDWSAFSCVIAAAIGYALFWQGMLAIKSLRGRFCIATLWFGGIQAIHLSWFMSDRYVGFYIYLFLALLLTLLGAQFGLVSLWVRPAKELGLVRILGISGAWALLEWGRLHVLSGFSWNPTGIALGGTLYGMQSASIFGVYGMGFWIFLVNLLALKLFGDFSYRRLFVWSALCAAPYLFGAWQLDYRSKQMEKLKQPPLSALVVQTALSPEEKISINGSSALSPYHQWERIVQMLTKYRDEQIDLIVLSEAVVPYGTTFPFYHVDSVKLFFDTYFGKQEWSVPPKEGVGNRFWAQSLANTFDADVVIGLEDVDQNEDPARAYNAAFLFRPNQEEYQRYEKRVLVPMGEYIPFSWCRKILSKYGIQDSFAKGKSAKVFQGKRAPFSLSICYEETYGHLMREGRLNGSELLINLSNDVWYPDSRLPIVHFFHGRLRSVESGIPLIRSCNTGVTCAVDALGRICGSLEPESSKNKAPAEVLKVSLPLYHYNTFYARLGDLPILCASAFFVILTSFSHLSYAAKRVILPVFRLNLHE